MQRQVGAFIQSLQEPIAVRRPSVDNPYEFTDVFTGITYSPPNDWQFANVEKVRAVVQASLIKTAEGNFVEEENRYVAHVNPPREEIRQGDEVERASESIGRINNQVLIITEMQIFRGVQRLRLEDREQPIA